MNDSVVIVYNGEQVTVPKEVADFLEQDRKRQQAQDKQDARHLSKSEFETVLSGLECVKRPVEGGLLADDGGDRSDLRHLQNGGIKATEKSCTKSWEALSHDRASQLFLKNFLFSGLQTRSECPYQ